MPFRLRPRDAINSARDAGGRVIAVGTTTTRALEDAARHADGGRHCAPGAEATVFIHPGFDVPASSTV